MNIVDRRRLKAVNMVIECAMFFNCSLSSALMELDTNKSLWLSDNECRELAKTKPISYEEIRAAFPGSIEA